MYNIKPSVKFPTLDAPAHFPYTRPHHARDPLRTTG